ncbi:HEPN domain-containing protein [Caldivirga sp. UBA161]|uniref:HEPN domain-containing protein n=1 Tax=Caldivirga sp. UBA161 TaxID=1915569 RepID=UPI0025BB63BF|nr:HEPN domain-containing protein [Caldivirga sp. UBA161]
MSELIKRAEDWFEVAKYALREGRFWLTCYASHQAVELYANDVLFMGLVHTHSLII